MSNTERYWAVIPAAGAGKRMQSDIPKQYLQINGKPIIEYTLEVFTKHPDIEAVIVAISDTDEYWNELPVSRHPKVKTTEGGIERCHSVMNCLDYLSDIADESDWVLVHDAARPCLKSTDIDKLINNVSATDGGLLALPVRDTMKRSNDRHVSETVSREGLWHALTPQMFRLHNLQLALKAVIDSGELVTDESLAMERAGYRPLLVEGRPDNIKVTHNVDLYLATLYLTS
ncbi:MAG TPA: 2-C-methyl-D-erythritol 4-phosphate cytidylyltransferase [Gammaproteobacteria bacterium]